jgi:hypothetical protein
MAAFFLRVFPEILDQKLNLPTELLTVLFGVGVLFTLMMQPKGVIEDLTNLSRLIATKIGLVKPASPMAEETT